MTFNEMLPAVTPLAAALFFVGLAHFLRWLARQALKKARSTPDTADDLVAEKWNTRAMWFETLVIFTVRYFVPKAFAPDDDVDGEKKQ